MLILLATLWKLGSMPTIWIFLSSSAWMLGGCRLVLGQPVTYRIYLVAQRLQFGTKAYVSDYCQFINQWNYYIGRHVGNLKQLLQVLSLVMLVKRIRFVSLLLGGHRVCKKVAHPSHSRQGIGLRLGGVKEGVLVVCDHWIGKEFMLCIVEAEAC